MLLRIAALTIAATLLSIGAALARTDVDILGDFEIIIGDTGDRYDGWDREDTRTYVRVRDNRGRIRDGYFSSIASAFFVLKERYGRVEVLDVEVPEYAGARHESHGHQGHGMLDGTRAYYFWDTERRARGGMPLILAFHSHRDAREMSYYREGEVLDFYELVATLKQWNDRYRTRVYWRGYDNNRWTHSSWNNAWNRRWQGYGWDRNDGWRLRVNIDRDGDLNVRDVRYRNNGVGVVVRNDDNGRGRGRGRDNHNGRGRGRDRDHDHDDDDDRGRDRDDDRGRDDNGKYERERSRERNR